MEESIIPDASQTISGAFRERLNRTPDKVAYRQFDTANQSWNSSTWSQMAAEVARWQAALAKENLQPGDRVALMLKNCREWVVFDQAALGMGLVTIPLYVEDRPDNVVYILNDANVKLLVIQNSEQCRRLLQCEESPEQLQRIITLQRVTDDNLPNDPRLESLPDWLFGMNGELQHRECSAGELTSIVYTSGTTGRPKGVMLSHRNMLANAYAGLQCADVGINSIFLSFLPLSHTLERTIGYYLPMLIGAEVAYARSIPQLAEDLLSIKPTVLVSVPRIYERVYGKIQDGLAEKSPVARKLFLLAVNVGWARFEFQQGRRMWSPKLLLWPLLNKLVAGKVLEKLGGRINVAICGGAALSPDVAKLFIGLGLPLIQGYGLTETSPVISVNRVEDNIPSSIGTPLPGIEVRIGENDELQSRSACVMLGYWNNEQASNEIMMDDGWLRTGDKARIDDSGHIFITGRLKEIIVLANGEKVPPNDAEMAIALDSLFDQVVVIGEARPYLTALLVLNPEHWDEFANKLGMDPENPESLSNNRILKAVLQRVNARMNAFPGYAQIRRISLYIKPWSIDDDLLTPTLKVKRNRIAERFSDDINSMYKGH